MIRRALLHSLLLCSCLIGLLSGCKSEPIALGLHPKRGQELDVVLSMSQRVIEERGDREVESTQYLTLSWTQTVEELRADGSMVISLLYQSAKLTAASPDFGRMEYDSKTASETVPPLAIGLDASIGERLQLEIDSNGEIRSLPGIAEFIDRVASNLKLPLDADAAAARVALRSRFSAESVREMMRPILSIYPQGLVAKGESWKRNATVREPYPHLQRNEYELVGVDQDLATIRVRSRLSPLSDAPVRQTRQGSVRFEVEGTLRGKLRIDRESGFVLVGELLQKLEGTISYELPGAETVVTPVRIEGHIEYATNGVR